MIRYVPVTTGQANAETLSHSLWSLHRTPEQQASEVTEEAFMVILALNSSAWLVVDTELTVLVHASATIGDIGGILLAAGRPQSEVDTLEAAIIAARGGEMNLWDNFPQVFKDASKDRDQMIAAGLLDPDATLSIRPRR